jgi:two-component system, NarL family, response regulator NreC
MRPTTVVLADDHPVVRQGMRVVLETQPNMAVVGEADEGATAIRLVEQLQPDVLILDLAMPGLGGVEVAWQVHRRVPQTRIIILSMYADEAYVVQALRNGAVGYVLKGAPPAELVRAVREVTQGYRYLSPPLSERAIELYLHRAEVPIPTPYDRLTAREREVLGLIGEGQTSSQIATRLCISPRTVETHRTNLLRKLDLSSQTELIRFAVQHGLGPQVL